MKKMILFTAVLAALLLFGCTGGGGGPVAGTASPSAAASQGAGASVAASEQPSQQASVQAGNGLQGLGYEQLIALGTPAQCTVRTASSGQTYTGNVFFLSGKFRYEADLPTAQGTFHTVVILKDNKVYTLLPAEQKVSVLTDCDWLVATAEATPQTGQQGTTGQLEQVPAVDFSCTPGDFGAEKFDTPGKVCDLTQMMGQPTATPT